MRKSEISVDFRPEIVGNTTMLGEECSGGHAFAGRGNDKHGLEFPPVSICVGCGLCCDGTLFANVQLDPDESAEALTEIGFEFFKTDDGIRAFRQPCSAFCGDTCNIYDDRPNACRSFSCRLLKNVDEGEVSEGEARAQIVRARELRDALRPKLAALVGSSGSTPLSQLYRELRALMEKSPDRAALQRENADLLFDVVALRRLLSDRFEYPTGGVMAPTAEQ